MGVVLSIVKAPATCEPIATTEALIGLAAESLAALEAARTLVEAAHLEASTEQAPRCIEALERIADAYKVMWDLKEKLSRPVSPHSVYPTYAAAHRAIEKYGLQVPGFYSHVREDGPSGYVVDAYRIIGPL